MTHDDTSSTTNKDQRDALMACRPQKNRLIRNRCSGQPTGLPKRCRRGSRWRHGQASISSVQLPPGIDGRGGLGKAFEEPPNAVRLHQNGLIVQKVSPGRPSAGRVESVRRGRTIGDPVVGRPRDIDRASSRLAEVEGVIGAAAA